MREGVAVEATLLSVLVPQAVVVMDEIAVFSILVFLGGATNGCSYEMEFPCPGKGKGFY
jgi:hypothetical protein